MINVFAACKVGSVVAGIASGVFGAIGAIPDMKDAIAELKSSKDIPEVKTYVTEDGIEVTEF